MPPSRKFLTIYDINYSCRVLFSGWKNQICIGKNTNPDIYSLYGLYRATTDVTQIIPSDNTYLKSYPY